MKSLAAAFVALLLCVQGATATPSTSPQPALGVAAHIGRASPQEVDRQVALAASAGFRMIRWELQWKDVEQSKGDLRMRPNWNYTVDKIRAHGLESLLILDYGNSLYDGGDKPRSAEAIAAFARYAEFVVTRLKGRVRYYQVWNEWNGKVGGTTPGTAKDYVTLARATYSAIKRADPDATVIVGGMSSSALNSLVGFGDRSRIFEDFLGFDVSSFGDAVAIHPYVVYKSGEWASIEGFDKLMRASVARIRATPGLAKTPIYITEVGWSTSAPSARGVGPEGQSAYLARAIDLATELGIATLIVYELQDGNGNPDDTEGNFGLVTRRDGPKPAFEMIRARTERLR